MCESRVPTVGADSAESYVRFPFRVVMDTDDGGRCEVLVHAMGRHEARGVAWQTAIDRGYDPIAVLSIKQEEVAA